MSWKTFLQEGVEIVQQILKPLLTEYSNLTKNRLVVEVLFSYLIGYLILEFAYETTGISVLGKLATFIDAVGDVLIGGVIFGRLGYGVTSKIMVLCYPDSTKASILQQASPMYIALLSVSGNGSIGGFIGGLTVLAFYALIFGSNPFEVSCINLLVRDVGFCLGGAVSYFLLYRRRGATVEHTDTSA